MATLHSDLYGTPPNADPATTPIYRGPSGHMAKGTSYVVRGTVTIASALGAGDTAKLLKVPEGVKVLRVAVVPSADLDSGNTFTFNLGWTSNANTHAAASTGLQSASAYELSAASSAGSAAAADGDELLLARVAGSLSAGSLAFVVELSV